MVQFGMDRRGEDWVDEVPYVAIVVCEPDGGTPDERTAFMRYQQQFVNQIVSTYKRIHEGTQPDAIAVLYFGNNDYRPPPGVPVCIRFPPHDSTVLTHVGRALLKSKLC